MLCHLSQWLLPLAADEERAGWIVRQALAHAATCERCEARLASLRRDIAKRRAAFDALASAPLPDEAGEERFWYAIRRELRTAGVTGAGREPAPEPRALPVGLWVRGLLAAAVIAVAAIFYTQTGEGPTAPGRTASHAEPSAEPEPVRVVEVRSSVGGLERVSSPEGARGFLETTEPFGPEATEYQLEGWSAPRSSRAVEEF